MENDHTVFLPLVVQNSSTQTDNIVKNSSFELGTISWVFHTDTSGQFDVNPPGYQGLKAADVSITTQGENVQLFQNGITLEPNTRYRFEFSARSNSENDFSIYLHKHDSPYTNYGLSDYVVNLSDAWQTFSTEFTTTNFTSTVDDARLRFWFSPYADAGDQYYIDQVIIYPIEGSSPPPPQNEGNAYYVSPGGDSDGDGSWEHPWDLKTALDQPSAVEPGDTIWLREGIYGDGGGTVFRSQLTGEADQYITVRSYPGEQARIDGGMIIEESWVIFQDLEVMNSSPDRLSNEASSTPSDISQKYGFDIRAANTKFINNIVHDTKGGFFASYEWQNVEYYGNVVYNNGWQGPDRGHGHGIYTKNENDMKWVRENIIFNNFSDYGVHFYTGDSGSLKGLTLTGNVNFNGRLLVGGGQPAERITVAENYTYNSTVSLGYSNENNQDLRLINNFFWGQDSSAVLEVKWWQELEGSGNTIGNQDGEVVSLALPGNWQTYQWDYNTYSSPDRDAFAVDDETKRWDEWKEETEFDTNSVFVNELPAGVEVFVRPNEYEAKRANIIIYNWDELDLVPVGVTNIGLEIGDHYTLHNAQNYFDETISGIYDGNPINVPMTGWSILEPIGWDEPLQPLTFPQFGVFILLVEGD